MREDDVEDGVGATALLVHVGGGDRTGLVPLRHQRLNILSTQTSSSLPPPPSSSSSLAPHCYFQTRFETKNRALYLCKRVHARVRVYYGWKFFLCVYVFVCTMNGRSKI